MRAHKAHALPRLLRPGLFQLLNNSRRGEQLPRLHL
nr:MAG TPA: hypothetical protein [Caudoviricetes sp.]